MRECLVVDDSSVVRKVARRILEDLDFSVSEAADGAKALELCKRAMPDVILLDWLMPVMDGIAFLEKFRKEEAGNRPKVVLCTTENDVAQIRRAIRAGANDCLLKPFTRELVEAKLQQIGAL